MKTRYKALFLVPVFGITMNACKTFYENTFVMTNDNKVLVKDGDGEERLVDCTKNKQMSSDLPYFKEGDPIKMQTSKSYTGYRVFKYDESVLEYNHDTIQIRKDREKIDAFKQKAAEQQKQK